MDTLTIDPGLVVRAQLAQEHPELVATFDQLQLGGVCTHIIVEDHRRRGALELLARIVAEAMIAENPT